MPELHVITACNSSALQAQRSGREPSAAETSGKRWCKPTPLGSEPWEPSTGDSRRSCCRYHHQHLSPAWRAWAGKHISHPRFSKQTADITTLQSRRTVTRMTDSFSGSEGGNGLWLILSHWCGFNLCGIEAAVFILHWWKNTLQDLRILNNTWWCPPGQ